MYAYAAVVYACLCVGNKGKLFDLNLNIWKKKQNGKCKHHRERNRQRSASNSILAGLNKSSAFDCFSGVIPAKCWINYRLVGRARQIQLNFF